MSFLGALGGIGAGISAGTKDLQDAAAARQKLAENELRMQAIQQGITKEQKDQDLEDAYRKDRSGYETAQDKYKKQLADYNDKNQQYDAEKSSARTAQELVANQGGQGVYFPPAGGNISSLSYGSAKVTPSENLLAPKPAIPSVITNPNAVSTADTIRQELAKPNLKDAPQAPKQPGFHDDLMDLVNLARIDVKHGKATAASLHPLLSTLKNAEDEGMSNSLKIALTGDEEGAKKMFESTGVMRDASGVRFEPSTFDPGNGMKPMKSVVAIMPNGKRIDAAGALFAKNQAEDVLGAYFKQTHLDTEKKKVDNEGKAQAATGIYQGRMAGVAEKNADTQLAAVDAKTAALEQKAKHIENRRLFTNDGVKQLDTAYGIKRDPLTSMIDPDSIKDKAGYYRDSAEMENRVNNGENPMTVAGELAARAMRAQKLSDTSGASETASAGTPKKLW